MLLMNAEFVTANIKTAVDVDPILINQVNDIYIKLNFAIVNNWTLT